MHLAIVSPFPPGVTGISQYGYYISQLLAKTNLFSRITILSGHKKGPAEAQPPIVFETGWQPGRAGSACRIPARLSSLKPDIIWCNLGVSAFGKSPLANLSGFLSVNHVHRLGLPVVVTMHELPELADLRSLKAPGGSLAIYGARLLTKLVTNADVVCLTLQRYANWFSMHHKGPKCLHIPIGAYHSPMLQPESEPPGLLFFSTLAPFKGLEDLLKAFMTLKPSYPDLKLTVAGGQHVRFPGYSQQLRAKSQSLEGIDWLGEVPEDALPGLFQRSRVVVLPYLASTGSSSVMMQAAAWGRSIVASNLTEIRVAASENGLELTFFQRGDISSLVEALKSHLDMAELRQNQIQHNFTAIQRYRPEVTCQAYLKAFNLAFESHRLPQRLRETVQFPKETP